MARRYKSSYRGRRSLKRFSVTFDPTLKPMQARKCVHCGGDLEAVPMFPGTCYECYRNGKHKKAS